eukprot:s172_g40.t1
MSIILLFYRIPALVMCNCISLIFLSNFAFLGLAIFRVSESQGMSSIGIASSSSFSAISVIWVELVIFVTTLSLSLAIRSMLMYCAHLKMKGDNAAAQCSTKSALLHFLCDAVVTTDSDCCLVNNSESLAAFLSLGNQNVEGASLLDFMIPLEAKRMQGILNTFKETEVLASASNSALEQTGQLVNAFHSCLPDKYGYKIGIEALMIKHWSTQGEQYIIGLRESGDEFGQSVQGVPSDAEHSFLRSVSCVSGSTVPIDVPIDVPMDVPIMPSRQMFLVIDVDDAQVCAASAGLQEAVGVMLPDMFQTPTVELLKRLQREAKLSEANGEPLGPLSLSLFSFSDMPVRMDGRDGRDGTMSGTMQILQHIRGSLDNSQNSLPRTRTPVNEFKEDFPYAIDEEFKEKFNQFQEVLLTFGSRMLLQSRTPGVHLAALQGAEVRVKSLDPSSLEEIQAWVAALPEGCPCVLAVAGEAGAFDTLLTKLQEAGLGCPASLPPSCRVACAAGKSHSPWQDTHAGSTPLQASSSQTMLRGPHARPTDARWLSTQEIVDRRPRMVQCVEDGSFNRVSTEIFRKIDREGVGKITWNSGEIRDFITQVLAQFGLHAPPEGQVYQLYSAFDRDKSGSLSLSECLRLVEAIVRAAFSIKFEARGGSGPRLSATMPAPQQQRPSVAPPLAQLATQVLKLEQRQQIIETLGYGPHGFAFPKPFKYRNRRAMSLASHAVVRAAARSCSILRGVGSSQALHALQISVSSDGETHSARGPPDSLELSVNKALQPWLTAGAQRFNASCSRCLRSCLPGEDDLFRQKASFETCVGWCGQGCAPIGLPKAADYFHEGVNGPENQDDWGAWILSLHNLQQKLSTLHWARDSGDFESPEFLRSSAAYAYLDCRTSAKFKENHLHSLTAPCSETEAETGYLKDLKQRFGGVDQVLLWAGYPNLGVDTRSNLDLMESLPGGLRAAVDALKEADPSVMVQPWDISTNGLGQDDPARYGALLAKAGADGLNLDTMDSLGPFVAGVPHAIIEPELGLYNGLFLLNTTAQGWLYSLAQTAYFNAIGYTAWENIFGIWNGINPRDGELLKRSMMILRHFHSFLSDPAVSWLPFYPVKKLTPAGEHVYVSKFVGADKELFLIINTGTETAGTQDRELHEEL